MEMLDLSIIAIMLDASDDATDLLGGEESPGPGREFREVDDHIVGEDAEETDYYSFDLDCASAQFRDTGMVSGMGSDEETYDENLPPA